MPPDSAADILRLRLQCLASGGRTRSVASLKRYEMNMQQNVFRSSGRATVLPRLFAMLLVLGAPLGAQEFGAAVAIGDDEILIGEPLNQRRPSTIYRYRQSADGWEQVGTMRRRYRGGVATTSAVSSSWMIAPC